MRSTSVLSYSKNIITSITRNKVIVFALRLTQVQCPLIHREFSRIFPCVRGHLLQATIRCMVNLTRSYFADSSLLGTLGLSWRKGLPIITSATRVSFFYGHKNVVPKVSVITGVIKIRLAICRNVKYPYFIYRDCIKTAHDPL